MRRPKAERLLLLGRSPPEGWSPPNPPDVFPRQSQAWLWWPDYYALYRLHLGSS